MTNIRTRVSTLLSGFCSSVLAVLGFGCSSGNEPCMYGTPYSTFEVKGKVTTEAGDPVANAIVRITGPDIPSGICSFSETNTGKTGEYIAKGSITFGCNKLKVVCIPEEKGLDADSITVDTDFTPDHSDNSWYLGHADANADLKLKNKAGE